MLPVCCVLTFIVIFSDCVQSFTTMLPGLFSKRCNVPKRIPPRLHEDGRSSVVNVVPFDDAQDNSPLKEAMKHENHYGWPSAFGFYQIVPENLYSLGRPLLPEVITTPTNSDKMYNFLHHMPLESDGLVHPRNQNFRGRRGPQFYRMQNYMEDMIDEMDLDEPVNILHKGAVLPDELTLVHSHYTSYCIEPRVPLSLQDYHAKLYEFFSTLRVVNKVQYQAEFR